MATGEAAQIIDALFVHCATLNVGSPPLPISYPEVAFTPPMTTETQPKPKPYLQVDWFGNRPAWEGLSSGKLAQGLLQITVVWPRGAGIVAPAEAAQQVIGHFAKGTALFDGSVKVTINQEPWAATPITEDTQLRIPVTVSWNAVAL